MLVYENFLVAKRQIQSGEAGGKKQNQAAFLSGKATPPPCACGAHCMAQAPSIHAACTALEGGAPRMKQEHLDSSIHRNGKPEMRLLICSNDALLFEFR